MFTYIFKALNLSTKADLLMEIEAITIAEASAKGRKAFFEKFNIEPEESYTRKK